MGGRSPPVRSAAHLRQGEKHPMHASPNFSAQVAIALGLDPDTDEAEILAHVCDRAKADEDVEEGGDIALIKAGVHPRVRASDDGRGLVVTLLVPIKSGSETIGELNIRRANVRELKRAEELALRNAPIGKGRERIEPGPTARMVATIATLSGRSPGEIEDIDPDDLGALGAAVGFLSRRRPTGPK